jgi:hypothetical protein
MTPVSIDWLIDRRHECRHAFGLKQKHRGEFPLDSGDASNLVN